jgi:hypothetical protein
MRITIFRQSAFHYSQSLPQSIAHQLDQEIGCVRGCNGRSSLYPVLFETKTICILHCETDGYLLSNVSRMKVMGSMMQTGFDGVVIACVLEFPFSRFPRVRFHYHHDISDFGVTSPAPRSSSATSEYPSLSTNSCNQNRALSSAPSS